MSVSREIERREDVFFYLLIVFVRLGFKNRQLGPLGVFTSAVPLFRILHISDVTDVFRSFLSMVYRSHAGGAVVVVRQRDKKKVHIL